MGAVAVHLLGIGQSVMVFGRSVSLLWASQTSQVLTGFALVVGQTLTGHSLFDRCIDLGHGHADQMQRWGPKYIVSGARQFCGGNVFLQMHLYRKQAAMTTAGFYKSSISQLLGGQCMWTSVWRVWGWLGVDRALTGR